MLVLGGWRFLMSEVPLYRAGSVPSSCFFFTLKPKVELYTKSISLKYEPTGKGMYLIPSLLLSILGLSYAQSL